LKKSQLIFNHICRAIIELNRVFSYPALLIITAKLVSLLNGLFMMIYQLLKPSSIAMGGLGVVLSVTITDLCIILVYITSADMPIQQVLAVINCKRPDSRAESSIQCMYILCYEVMSLMMMMDEDRIRLSGSRLFKVGTHLIPPVSQWLVLF